MTEQRLKVESGPPQHVISDADSGAGAPPSQEDSAAEGAKDKAQEAAAPAKEKAREVAGQAKEQARAAAGQAKEKTVAEADERSTQLGQQIGAQSQSLAGVAEELRRQGKERPAEIAEQAGQRVKDVGEYLEQTDGESLMQAATDAARENPAAAAAAGAAAGFAAGRLLKASRDEGSPEDKAPSEEDEPGRAGDGGG